MKLLHVCFLHTAQQIKAQLPYLEASDALDLFPGEAVNLENHVLVPNYIRILLQDVARIFSLLQR